MGVIRRAQILALTLNNLGIVYERQGDYGEAEGLHQRALATREKALGRDHPDVAQTLSNLANVYNAQGRYGEAEGLHSARDSLRPLVQRAGSMESAARSRSSLFERYLK
jgi:tetratricopeptide (TPR) repeat protein